MALDEILICTRKKYEDLKIVDFALLPWWFVSLCVDPET